jgi:putative aldouronate transport system substrate-binding protein
MKKWTATSIGMIMITGSLLSGCTGQEAAPKEAAPVPGVEKVTEAGVLPITKEKTTIKVLAKGNPYVENYSTNEFTKYLEEKTNIHIEWDIAPEKSAVEKLNLVLASGDLPDVIMGFSVPPTMQLTYGEQGTFKDLAPYIEKYGVETKKMFVLVPDVKDAITAPGQKIYALPSVNECYHCSLPQKMWIYQPWLDKLGLKMPTTTDELYEVLKAFKTKDPNGNGKADEIPLAGAAVGPFVTIDSFIMNAFTLNNGSRAYLNNGKVDVPFNKPEWRDGLAYLHKLYAEGLIAPQSFTQDRNQAKQMGENPDINILGAEVAMHNGVFTGFQGPSGRWLEVKSVPPLKGPKGVQITPYASSISQGQYVITNSSKNPEAAFRVADLLFNEEMSLLSSEGRLGMDWKYADKGEMGINGKQAIWKYTDTKKPFGTLQNDSWVGYFPTLRSNDSRLGLVNDPKNPTESILYNETKNNYEPYKQKIETLLPQLFFTNEQAMELADLDKTITDHVKEMQARFITGDASLEKDWDGYLKNLDNMKLKRYLEINQAAYDAKKK